MKKSIREDSETACFKIRKLDEELGDTGIYWRINEKRVLQFFRDQALADALEKRIDKVNKLEIKQKNMRSGFQIHILVYLRLAFHI